MEDVVDYGPLQGLIGTWRGDKGVDVAPEPEGTEREPYYEILMFEPVGTVANAEKEGIAALRYHQLVHRISNDEIFHNQTGYWMWSPSLEKIMFSLTIPRGVCILAGGTFSDQPKVGKPVTLSVAATLGDPDWGVIQSPFMRDNASTESFCMTVEVCGDSLTYSQTTMLDIYGRKFEHTDKNSLIRQS